MRKFNFLSILLMGMLLAPLSSASAKSLEPAKGRVGLGYTESSGNTDESKMNFTLNLTQKRTEQLKFGYDALAIYGKSDGQKNADKKQLKFSSEFIKNDKFSWYANIGYMEDEFAGYKEQYKLGLGMINYFIKGEETVFSCSLGLDFTKEEYTDNTKDDETWLRVGLDGKRKIADNVRFAGHFGFLAPKDDTDECYRTETAVGLIFTINDKIDAEMKYIIDYNKAPVDAKEKYDRTFITSISYKI